LTAVGNEDVIVTMGERAGTTATDSDAELLLEVSCAVTATDEVEFTASAAATA
jgi:hypothetical protein